MKTYQKRGRRLFLVLALGGLLTVPLLLVLGVPLASPDRAGSSNALVAGDSSGRAPLPTDPGGQAGTEKTEGRLPRVVVVLMEGVTAADFLSAPDRSSGPPAFASLEPWDDWAFALLNIRTPDGRPGSQAATVGAGTRAAGASEAGLLLEPDELWNGVTARAFYQLATGLAAPEGALVHLALPALQAANAKLLYRSVPGLLGQTASAAGVRTAAVGNSDLPGEPRRVAALMVMDERGLVGGGVVGEETQVKDAAAPYGVRTDWAVVTAAVRELLSGGARLVAVEAGDTARAALFATQAAPEAAVAHRREALRRAWMGVEGLTSVIDLNTDTLLVLTTGAPSQVSGEWPDSQGFGLVLGRGRGFSPGPLCGPTTRRAGLVSNIDVAPTIAGLLSLDLGPEALGRPFGPSAPSGAVRDTISRGVSGSDAEACTPAGLSGLASFYRDSVRADLLRPRAIQVYVTLDVLALLAAVALWWNRALAANPKARHRGGPPAQRPLRLAFLVLAAAPAAFLLGAALEPMFSRVSFLSWRPQAPYLLGFALSVLLLAGAGSSLAVLTNRPAAAAAAICAITVVAVLADLSTGARAAPDSVFGYSLASGSRYYGIGNEYAGLLVGGALALATYTPNPALTGTLFLAVAAAVAAPGAGANLGEGLAAAVGFAIFFGRTLRWPWRRSTAWIAIAATTTATLVAAADLFGNQQAGTETHIGLLVSRISHDASILPLTVARKLTMGLRVLRYTVWTKAVLAFLAFVTLATIRPARLLQAAAARTPSLRPMLAGTLGAALAGLLLNDSGVVAAATTIIGPTLRLFLAIEPGAAAGEESPLLSRTS